MLQNLLLTLSYSYFSSCPSIDKSSPTPSTADIDLSKGPSCRNVKPKSQANAVPTVPDLYGKLGQVSANTKYRKLGKKLTALPLVMLIFLLLRLLFSL